MNVKHGNSIGRNSSLSETAAKPRGTVIKYKDPLAADSEIFKGPIDHLERDVKPADVPSVELKESVASIKLCC